MLTVRKRGKPRPVAFARFPLCIKLNDVVGKWGGDISTAKLPDRFLVNYVRVYDLADAKWRITVIMGGKTMSLRLLLLSMATFFLVIASSMLAEEPNYAPMPWHLVDIWWDLGEAAPFQSYSIDVTISNDVSPDVSLYIAPVGIAHLNKIPFYGGIQTQTDGHTKADHRIRKIGPGLLMSMWGERSLDAIRPSIDGLCQSSGHEGDFVSVRRRYQWSKGTYTYRVVHMDKEVIDGKPFTWVGAFVYSHEKDENVFIGALRFKGENLVLSRKAASFVEIYGRRIPLTKIPKVTVAFGNLKINGRSVTVRDAQAVYPKGVPDYAEAKMTNGTVVVEVGKPAENRTERNTHLTGN